MDELAQRKAELKKIIITTLNLMNVTEKDIADDAPLFREGLGLDSIDALELAMALEKHYKVKFANEKIAQQAFRSIQSLAEYIQKEEGASNGKSQ